MLHQMQEQTGAAGLQGMLVQYLDQQGRPTVGTDVLPDIQTLQNLYQHMVFGRLFDEKRLNLQRQGRIGTFAPTTGQEATICGAAMAMQPDDFMVISFREAPAQIMRGVEPWRVLLYDAGFEEGNEYPEGVNVLPLAVVVASQTLHAVGLAYAFKYRGEKRAVLAYVGDGGTSEGDFYEAMNFAGVWDVGVVILIQNNQWAISTPLEKQTRARTLAQKAVAAGIRGVRIDGNDPAAVLAEVGNALDRARQGGGPTVVEAVTYRMLMHTTADDPRRYRSEKEVEEWRKKDPILRLRAYLQSQGAWDDDKEKGLIERVRRELEEQVALFEGQAKKLLESAPDAAFHHVYADMPPYLEAQHREFLKRLREARR